MALPSLRAWLHHPQSHLEVGPPFARGERLFIPIQNVGDRPGTLQIGQLLLPSDPRPVTLELEHQEDAIIPPGIKQVSFKIDLQASPEETKALRSSICLLYTS